jgi:hypothetical protein
MNRLRLQYPTLVLLAVLLVLVASACGKHKY